MLLFVQTKFGKMVTELQSVPHIHGMKFGN